MAGATEILNELERRGVTVAVDGDTLCLKPRRVLDDALLVRVRESKPAILAVLRRNAATRGVDAAPCGSADCAGCYDVGDGRRIHPPKIGKDYLAWLERWNPKGTAQ